MEQPDMVEPVAGSEVETPGTTAVGPPPLGGVGSATPGGSSPDSREPSPQDLSFLPREVKQALDGAPPAVVEAVVAHHKALQARATKAEQRAKSLEGSETQAQILNRLLRSENPDVRKRVIDAIQIENGLKMGEQPAGEGAKGARKARKLSSVLTDDENEELTANLETLIEEKRGEWSARDERASTERNAVLAGAFQDLRSTAEGTFQAIGKELTDEAWDKACEAAMRKHGAAAFTPHNVTRLVMPELFDSLKPAVSPTRSMRPASTPDGGGYANPNGVDPWKAEKREPTKTEIIRKIFKATGVESMDKFRSEFRNQGVPKVTI